MTSLTQDELVVFPGGFPTVPSPTYTTPNGVPYLIAPGVTLLAKPEVSRQALAPFLQQFPHFDRSYTVEVPELPGGTQICKIAGQLCYFSFVEKRTTNAHATEYFHNIRKQRHGSVLEHATYSFLFYGIDRAVTHELVRHRAGFAFSQVSQRYCDGKTLRFVLRPEFSEIEAFRQRQELFFEQVRAEYLRLADALAGNLTDARRKTINQAARTILPNSTEAPIVVTANVRSWRHFIETRGSVHADLPIRELAHRVLKCLRFVEPILFADYETDSDGAIVTHTPKV